MSNASFVSEVEMATDEIFAGPMSESVPTSVTSFQYRSSRQRAGSIISFTYFQEDDEPLDFSDEEAVVDSDEEIGYATNGHDRDLETGSVTSRQRKSSNRSRISADQPLLLRRSSHRSDTQELGNQGNFSQRIHLVNEDLAIVVAGFTTSFIGYLAYLAICILTAGIGFLVFRWVPRWRIKLVGRPSPLSTCAWVVVEVSDWVLRRHKKKSAKSSQNQWGEFTVHDVLSEEYEQPLSTVFGIPSKEAMNGYGDDDDPTIGILRYLDYRYMRLLYHPLEDKFMLNDDWWDPQWTAAKALRAGLDADEQDIRDQVFGKNMIEIREKTIAQLLLDEVWILSFRGPCR